MTRDAGSALWGCEQQETPRALAGLLGALAQGWSGLVTLSCTHLQLRFMAYLHQEDWHERKINYKYESKPQPNDRPHRPSKTTTCLEKICKLIISIKRVMHHPSIWYSFTETSIFMTDVRSGIQLPRDVRLFD